MVSSAATTVAAYLAELPADRRAVIASVRELVLAHLPPGYEERMNWGMLAYEVPMVRSGPTYNGQPLCYVALAAQKQKNSLYLMAPYVDPALLKALQDGFRRSGKKLDMGKSCVRFRTLDDLPLDTIGEVIARVPLETFLAWAQAAHGARKAAKKKATKTATPKAGKTVTKKATKKAVKKTVKQAVKTTGRTASRRAARS